MHRFRPSKANDICIQAATTCPSCNLHQAAVLAMTGIPVSRNRQREAQSISGREDAVHDMEPDLETVHLVGDMPVSTLLQTWTGLLY